MQNKVPNSSGPWWKFGHMWMVVGGPAVVVVASFFTIYLAITRPDPVISEDYYQQGIQINQQLDAQAAASLAPAIKARNHAATGVAPPTSPVKP
ncbi:MAG: FixH family protein [Rhodoferax sp.]